MWLKETIKRIAPFERIKYFFEYGFDYGVEKPKEDESKAMYKNLCGFLIGLLVLSLFFFFAKKSTAFYILCILYFVLIAVLFLWLRKQQTMELLYYWQKMSWLSVWFITVKIGLFTFCIENRIKEVALGLLILSFFLFVFLLAEKVICSIIMLYVPKRRIKTKAKLLKKVYGNINGFIGGCFFVCLSGFKHSRDFSDSAMQLLMICVSGVLGMIYYQYIIAIPFNLIYKEEIDADLGL